MSHDEHNIKMGQDAAWMGRCTMMDAKWAKMEARWVQMVARWVQMGVPRSAHSLARAKRDVTTSTTCRECRPRRRSYANPKKWKRAHIGRACQLCNGRPPLALEKAGAAALAHARKRQQDRETRTGDRAKPSPATARAQRRYGGQDPGRHERRWRRGGQQNHQRHHCGLTSRGGG